MNAIKPRFLNHLVEEVPEEVARLASELHCQRNQNLTIEILIPVLPKKINDIFCVEGGYLTFASIEARNHCTAVYYLRQFEKSDLALNVLEIFDRAQQLWICEIGHTDFTSGRLLGLLSQKVDILKAGKEIIASSDARKDLSILKNIGNALPFLTGVNLVDLIDLAAQHSKTSGDMVVANMFFNQVSAYLSSYPRFAKELYVLVRENMTATNTRLYGAALISLAASGQDREATELAISDTDSASNDRLSGALCALGCLSRKSLI